MNDVNGLLEYDEINLKQLILRIWGERKIISIITIGCLVITLIYNNFISTPVFEATSNVIIKIPESTITRFGTYVFPSQNTNDYIQYIYSNDVVDKVIKENNLQITRAAFRNIIEIKYDSLVESNRFEVLVSLDNAELAKKINDDLMDQYIKSIRVTFKRNALDFFTTNYQVSIDNLKESIRQQNVIMNEIKTLLDSIQPTFKLQKALFSDSTTAAAYADNLNLNLSDLSEYVMTEEYVNTNYIELQSQYIGMETELISMTESLAQKQYFYAELINERKLFEEALKNNEIEKVNNGRLDVISPNISIISAAYIPEKPVSPKSSLNIAIGVMVGLITGIFIGLFKSYWITH